MGVTSLVAGYVLSDILAKYRRAYPQVSVRAIEGDGSYLEYLLIGGELDAAIMVVSNMRNHDALQAEILETSPYKLWLPMGHELTTVERIDPSDLSLAPLILLTIDEIEGATEKLLGALDATPEFSFRTRLVEAVRSLVATGAGLALLPDLIYRPWSLERIELRTEMFQRPCRLFKWALYGAEALHWLKQLGILLRSRNLITISSPFCFTDIEYL